MLAGQRDAARRFQDSRRAPVVFLASARCVTSTKERVPSRPCFDMTIFSDVPSCTAYLSPCKTETVKDSARMTDCRALCVSAFEPHSIRGGCLAAREGSESDRRRTKGDEELRQRKHLRCYVRSRPQLFPESLIILSTGN
jgi:hypothetical protein